jgi:hypothetical protein
MSLGSTTYCGFALDYLLSPVACHFVGGFLAHPVQAQVLIHMLGDKNATLLFSQTLDTYHATWQHQ